MRIKEREKDRDRERHAERERERERERDLLITCWYSYTDASPSRVSTTVKEGIESTLTVPT